MAAGHGSGPGEEFQRRRLAVGPKIEAVQLDSHEVRIPLMNPGDKLFVRLMTGNEAGRILVTAKGPSLKFKRFDPTTFISPAVNRGLLVLSGGIFAWIIWACVGTDRFMARPFWDKTITLVLIGVFLALPSAVLAYHGTIPPLEAGSPVEGKEQNEHSPAY